MNDDRQEQWRFPPELELLESAGRDLPALDTLTQTTLALGFGRQALGRIEQSHQTIAIEILGSMAFRAARSAAMLIGAGYGSEAWPQCRRLTEIAARVEKIDADSSGQRAVAWLEGKGEGAARLIGQDVWSFLSPAAHADARHLPYMSLKKPDGPTIYFFPCRDRVDEALILKAAIDVLDVAVVFHRLAGEDLEGVRGLREKVGEHIDRIQAPES